MKISNDSYSNTLQFNTLSMSIDGNASYTCLVLVASVTSSTTVLPSMPAETAVDIIIEGKDYEVHIFIPTCKPVPFEVCISNVIPED